MALVLWAPPQSPGTGLLPQVRLLSWKGVREGDGDKGESTTPRNEGNPLRYGCYGTISKAHRLGGFSDCELFYQMLKH